MIVKFSKEYTLGSKKIKEIDVDLEGLTGKDLMDCEREYRTRAKDSIIKELEDGWALTIAAKATGLKYGDFLKLGAIDFMKITGTVKGFLNKSWDSNEELLTTSENMEDVTI